MSLKRAGQKIHRLWDVFVHLTQKLIRRKEPGKMKMLHMAKNLLFHCCCSLGPILPEELPGQSFSYKTAMTKMNFKGLLQFALKPVINSLFFNLVFNVFK